MYYQVREGTALYEQLTAFMDKVEHAQDKARELAKKHGFESFRHRNMCIAGGISSFNAEKRPQFFKYAFGRQHPNDFFPDKMKRNRDLLREIEDLPVVKYEDLNRILNYNMYSSVRPGEKDRQHITFVPSLSYRRSLKLFLIFVVPNAKYTPVDGMERISKVAYEELRVKKVLAE